MRPFNLILITILFSSFGIQNAQSQQIHQHSEWNLLLQNHVGQNGKVDYKAFKKNESKLDSYLKLLGNNPPQDSWSKNEKKAYLINAYNAFTVKLIVENYPTESIRDIGGFFSNPFSTEFAKIGDKEYSLDDIEKGMLLKMGDPRVHFAVNCASESCPKLLNEAYVASKLDKQLDASASYFINSEENKLSRTKVELSKIFKWYASDFEKDGNSVINFINTYSKETINEDASVSYLSYSWKLNEK
ncbi:DUF547 domain-containing protein [Psychroflexus lacisalsi]|jgi:hypothetical protein|uniref:DUF547 domain-containing protein n=1 Tax=Psychroflexus lacisalsi TaxID=503928 RepID=A0ABN1K1T0_9FLAO|nr:DUF547 domain-containing protein [Psychroflexus lacisalsi]MBZ9621039.1 DUF547 domain-containing protein [Psychroflexus lacisalsi]